MHAGVLDRPPFSGTADAALDFVGDQQNAVTIADAAKLLHENGRGDDITAFALHGLNEDGGDFLRRQRGLEELVFNETGTAQRISIGVLSTGVAVNVGIADVGYAGHQRSETTLLLWLRSGERERAHGASVESAEEGNN